MQHIRVGLENDKIGRWEKLTWPHLEELAVNCPEAGIHFQGKFRLLAKAFMPVNLHV